MVRFAFTPDHWPHLKLTSRLVAIAEYEWDGMVSFRNIMLIGMLLAPLHLVAFWKTNRSIPLAWFVPLGFLLLVPLRTTYWPVTSLAFPFVFLLGYLSLCALFQGRPARAVGWGFLASCSSGVGAFVPFVALPVLLLRKETSRRIWGWWSAYGLLCFGILFWLLHIKPEKILSADPGPAMDGLDGVAFGFSHLQLFSTTLLRAAYEVFQRTWSHTHPLVPVLALLGLVFHLALVGLVVWKRKEILEKAPHLLSFLMLLAVSSLMATWIRIDPALLVFQLPQERYLYVSVLYLITLSLLLLTLFPSMWRRTWIIALLALVSIYPYHQRFQHSRGWNNGMLNLRANLLLDALSLRHEHHRWVKKQMAPVFFDAAKAGVYHVPAEYIRGFYTLGTFSPPDTLPRKESSPDRVSLEDIGTLVRVRVSSLPVGFTHLVFLEEGALQGKTYPLSKEHIQLVRSGSGLHRYTIYLYKPALQGVSGPVELHLYREGASPELVDLGKTLSLPVSP